MTFAGSATFSSSNSSSSTSVAFFEKTLKLTPPGSIVAPSGALEPICTTPLFIFAVPLRDGVRVRNSCSCSCSSPLPVFYEHEHDSSREFLWTPRNGHANRKIGRHLLDFGPINEEGVLR